MVMINTELRTQNNQILVLGSTGKTGRRVTQRLIDKGYSVRAASRSGDYPFDWHDQSSWSPMLENIRSVYVTYQPDLIIPAAAGAIRSLAEIAKKSGVEHIVLLSGRGEAGAQQSEEALKQSGIDYTILRCSWFSQNFSENFLVDSVIAGEVALPAGNVPEPFIDVEDIADVAVAALTESHHIGHTYELTGPRMLTFTQAVREIAHATDRNIEFRDISTQDFLGGLNAHHVPEDIVMILGELFTQVLDGRNSWVADGVQRALGRDPRDFSEYARTTAATGIWETA